MMLLLYNTEVTAYAPPAYLVAFEYNHAAHAQGGKVTRFKGYDGLL